MPLWVLLILLVLGVKKIPLWIIFVGYFALDGLMRVVAWLQREPKKQDGTERTGFTRPMPQERRVAAPPERAEPSAIAKQTAHVILLPAPEINSSTQERAYMQSEIGELEHVAAASWHSLEHLVILAGELQYRSTRRGLALRESVDARIAELRRKVETLPGG